MVECRLDGGGKTEVSDEKLAGAENELANLMVREEKGHASAVHNMSGLGRGRSGLVFCVCHGCRLCGIEAGEPTQ